MSDSVLAVMLMLTVAPAAALLGLLLEAIAQPHLGMAAAMLALVVRRGGTLAEGVWLAVNAAALGLAPVHALVVDHVLLEGHVAVRVHAHEHQVHPRDAGLLVAASGCDVVAAAGASTAARGILCAVQQDRCPLVRWWLLLLHAVGFGAGMFSVAMGVCSSRFASLGQVTQVGGQKRESKNREL